MTRMDTWVRRWWTGLALAFAFGLLPACSAGTTGNSPDMVGLPDLLTGEVPDMVVTDMATTTTTDSGVKGHPAATVMSGAVSAKSANYRVIMSLGQGPGGNGTAASTNNKVRGGLVGATQGR
jgi:hypothetical protein